MLRQLLMPPKEPLSTALESVGLQWMKRMELKESNVHLSYKRQGLPNVLSIDVDNASRPNRSIAKMQLSINFSS